MSSMSFNALPDITAENVNTDGIDNLINAVCSRLEYNRTISWSWEVMNNRFGKSFLFQNRIVLNPIVLSITNPYTHLKDTVIHETCHVIAAVQHNDKGHGRAWKVCMAICGITPNRVTALSATDFYRMNPHRHRRFRYVCDSCGMVFIVSATKHHWILSGRKSYRTPCCRSTLTHSSDAEA